MFTIGLIAGLFVGACIGVFAAAFIVGRAQPCRHCGEGVPYKIDGATDAAIERMALYTLGTENQRPIA